MFKSYRAAALKVPIYVSRYVDVSFGGRAPRTEVTYLNVATGKTSSEIIRSQPPKFSFIYELEHTTSALRKVYKKDADMLKRIDTVEQVARKNFEALSF